MAVNVEDFERQMDCVYKDEHYSVRDNGAVLRFPRESNRKRSIDKVWTFGKPNDKTGYMEIVPARVHRIVATAFYGDPPTKEHVVDHIDTNKRNNRPENLRWVTRLENILLNPITIKRIESACGCSVEEFLADPTKFKEKCQEPNFEWMCTVTAEEAQICLKRMRSWAESDKIPSGGSLGEWIYNRSKPTPYVEDISEFTISLTPNAIQKDWKTPSEFPCCPQEFTEEPISAYAYTLSPGSLFCKNSIYSSLVFKSAISDDQQALYVVSESKSGVKPFALAEITYKEDVFIHTSLGTFFTVEGVEKQFCLAQGLEWHGGDSIDDYC